MAQVMKKICHDKSLGVSVHVAMDSGIENKYKTIFANIISSVKPFKSKNRDKSDLGAKKSKSEKRL